MHRVTPAVLAGRWPALAEPGGLRAGCKGAQSLEFVPIMPSGFALAFRGWTKVSVPGKSLLPCVLHKVVRLLQGANETKADPEVWVHFPY